MPTVNEVTKPVNAGWEAKVLVDPASGNVKIHGGDGAPVEVAWYPNGRIRSRSSRARQCRSVRRTCMARAAST
jgi:hypothetical protein